MKKQIQSLLFFVSLFGFVSMAATLNFTDVTPDSNDSLVILQQKTLQAINANSIARLQSASSVSETTPEGAVTADPGAGHFDSAANRFYLKATGSGNTGWVLILDL